MLLSNAPCRQHDSMMKFEHFEIEESPENSSELQLGAVILSSSSLFKGGELAISSATCDEKQHVKAMFLPKSTDNCML